MRHYYDFDDHSPETGRGPGARWDRGEKPAPYGDVPGIRTVPPEPGAVKSPRRRQKRARKTGGKRGVVGFILCLALLLSLAGGGYLLSGGKLALPSFDRLWDRMRGDWSMEDPRDAQDPAPSEGEGDGWEDWGFYDYSQNEEDWIAELPLTTAERAPLAEGVELKVSPTPEETLTPQEIYRKVNPSVVQIRSYLRNGYSLGTGVVVSAEGYIITNCHVISGARQIDAILADGRRCRAKLVGYDAGEDLAVVQIDPEGLELTVAELGDSSTLQVGDPAYAIGNPLGSELRGTFTSGIISAIDRSVATDGGSQTLLQTTAALNSGNSGGALVNAYGQVVGITNMKMMSSKETIEGLGFAIPTTVAIPVAEQLIATGTYVGRPMLGITVVTVEAGEITEKSPAGAYVYSVEPGSDAWKKGVREGDIIIAADDTSVLTTEDLLAAKAFHTVGDTMELKVWSSDRTRTVKVTLVGNSSLIG